jgi:GNAT superfamily N-acetyltransferase
MANAKIDILGPTDVPLISQLYNQMFQPPRDADSFRRRFLGRHNVLMLVASVDKDAVGFFVGFELKPDIFFGWLYGVLPEFRRHGIASQLMEAVHAWAKENEYQSVRFECHNRHRPMLHMAIAHGYDIVGIRWDPDRSANLVIFEKHLEEE